MTKKCEHKFKPYATINYTVYISEYDDGSYGWIFQDKIYECEDCYAKRIVTRACETSNREPLWVGMAEGKVIVNIVNSEIWTLLKERKLDNPEYPEINLDDLTRDGKTVIYDKILKY